MAWKRSETATVILAAATVGSCSGAAGVDAVEATRRGQGGWDKGYTWTPFCIWRVSYRSRRFNPRYFSGETPYTSERDSIYIHMYWYIVYIPRIGLGLGYTYYILHLYDIPTYYVHSIYIHTYTYTVQRADEGSPNT